MSKFCRILALFFMLVSPLQADQQGLVVRSATVYAEASKTSKRIGEIEAGTRVSIFSRKGGWKEIFSDQAEIIGWLRSYQVREGSHIETAVSGEDSDSRGFLSGLAALSRRASRFFTPGGSSTSAGTATIGVRGLSEAELKSARPDFAQLEKMQQFASNDARLVEFRRLGKLDGNDVAHIESKQKSALPEASER